MNRGSIINEGSSTVLEEESIGAERVASLDVLSNVLLEQLKATRLGAEVSAPR